jgi:hypothetical protein
MSSRIQVCPQCGHVAALSELTRKLQDDVSHAYTRDEGPDPMWQTRVLWCEACSTPILIAWPETMSADERRALVGLPPLPQEDSCKTMNKQLTYRARGRSKR